MRGTYLGPVMAMVAFFVFVGVMLFLIVHGAEAGARVSRCSARLEYIREKVEPRMDCHSVPDPGDVDNCAVRCVRVPGVEP